MPRRKPTGQEELFPSRLYYGDNLRILRDKRYIPNESVDLIYLDPPFKPTERYNVLFRTYDRLPAAAQVRAFEDTWRWDEAAAEALHDAMENAPEHVGRTLKALRSILGESDMFAYMCMMAPRLVEMHKVLSSKGSLYLHCDPAASHYLKVLMDAVFGPENFRNEVVWKRTFSHGGAHRYAPLHDILLFYTKGAEFVWHTPYARYDEAYIRTKFKHVDDVGRRFSDEVLTGPGERSPESASSQPWRGYDPTAVGRHWQPASYAYDKYRSLTGDDLAKYPLLERLDRLDDVGLIFWPPRGKVPRLKRFLEDAQGVPAGDVWTDIDALNSQARERLGYPTQKPEELLRRIICASSNPGDTLLDPFCGCGTAIEVAEREARAWIGIDIAQAAIRIIRDRLDREFGPSVRSKYSVWGEPESLEDAQTLAREDPYQFQWWAVRRLGAREVERRKGADRGVDGRLMLRTTIPGYEGFPEAIIQVKAGRSGPDHVRGLIGTLNNEDAPIGVLVTLKSDAGQMNEVLAKVLG